MSLWHRTCEDDGPVSVLIRELRTVRPRRPNAEQQAEESDSCRYPGPGSFAFHWAYTTADGAGPAGDIFGLLVDGTRIQLSDPGGAISQGGDRTFTAASSFGWFLNCTDCTGGAATAIVSSFAAVQAVPEPESYALLAAGLAVLGATVRRRRQTRQ